MRAMVVLLLAVALATPGAAAAASSLTLAVAESTVDSGSTVPVLVRVELRDFWCSQAREFSVEAMVRGSGAEASLPNGSLRFMTDDEPHFADSFTAEGELPVSVRALGAAGGSVEVVASLAPPADCFAPDGFPAASANVTLVVRPEPAAPQPEPATNEPAPADANETAPPANESADVGSANASAEPQESIDRLPPGSGYIGDYVPPENGKQVPGAGPAALLALIAVAALARRKR